MLDIKDIKSDMFNIQNNNQKGNSYLSFVCQKDISDLNCNLTSSILSISSNNFDIYKPSFNVNISKNVFDEFYKMNYDAVIENIELKNLTNVNKINFNNININGNLKNATISAFFTNIAKIYSNIDFEKNISDGDFTFHFLKFKELIHRSHIVENKCLPFFLYNLQIANKNDNSISRDDIKQLLDLISNNVKTKNSILHYFNNIISININNLYVKGSAGKNCLKQFNISANLSNTQYNQVFNDKNTLIQDINADINADLKAINIFTKAPIVLNVVSVDKILDSSIIFNNNSIVQVDLSKQKIYAKGKFSGDLKVLPIFYDKIYNNFTKE